MKQQEISISGTVTKEGKLLMQMGELNEFLKGWKGSKVVARFMVSNPGSSEAIKGYYYNYIVPNFKKAIWEAGERKSEKDTDKFIRTLSPICWEETPNPETGKYDQRLREINELDNREMSQFIEHLKELAATEYFFFIDDKN